MEESSWFLEIRGNIFVATQIECQSTIKAYFEMAHTFLQLMDAQTGFFVED